MIRADALNEFKENYTLYKAYADIFYANGKPSSAVVQLAAGDTWDGLKEVYKDAFSNPTYYIYLANVFTGTASNLNNIKFKSATIRNTKKISIKVENYSASQYRTAIAQKHGGTWTSIGNGKLKLEVGQNRYIYNPAASVSGEQSIYYFRNNKEVGVFRFNY